MYFWVVLDLEHPDDDDPFEVDIAWWLLWSPMHSTWLCHGSNTLAMNKSILGPFTSYSPVGYEPPYAGWIDLAYGNLHQRVRVERDQPMRTPVNPCYSGHSHVGFSTRNNLLLTPFTCHNLHPPLTTTSWWCNWWRDDSPRNGKVQNHNLWIHWEASQFCSLALMCLHLRGFYSPYWRRFKYKFDARYFTVSRYSTKRARPPFDWIDKMYTLYHLNGVMFNFNHKHRTRSSCTIGPGLPTPENT